MAEALQRMETAAGTRAVQAAEPRRFGGGKRRVPLEGAQYVKAAGKRLHIIGIGNSRVVAHGQALLQTLTRFPRLGSCTVKVSCDERFQRTAFYRRGHPMGGALVLSI